MRDTPRLTFRRPAEHDFEALWALWSNAQVQEGLINRPQTREEFAPLFAAMLASETIWIACERASGKPIGRCGFYEFGQDRIPELAYLLGLAWWGKGLATEMTQAALRYAFVERSWPRVVALILPDNVRSLAVAKKLGFAFDRTLEVRGRQAQLHTLDAPKVTGPG